MSNEIGKNCSSDSENETKSHFLAWASKEPHGQTDEKGEPYSDSDAGEESEFEERYRERRIAELKQQAAMRTRLLAEGHGKMTEISAESDLDAALKQAHKLLVFFYKSDFVRCNIMNAHLEKLAPQYFYTRFLKVDVDKFNQLASKNWCRVLPCIVLYRDGEEIQRFLGFERLGNRDDFATATLEKVLVTTGIMSREYRPSY